MIAKEENGKTFEPFEELTIDIPSEFTGKVIEKLSRRKGLLIDMSPQHGHTRLTFEIPTRGLLGYRGEFIIDTRGAGILAAQVIGFKPYTGPIEKHVTGSMVSMATGTVLGYALDNLQTRGQLYVGPNIEVYEGMVVGNTAKGDDLAVNPTKGKRLTNMRASGTDEAINLTPSLELTIERGLEIMHDDEYLEITPKNVRLRKQLLRATDRAKAVSKK